MTDLTAPAAVAAAGDFDCARGEDAGVVEFEAGLGDVEVLVSMGEALDGGGQDWVDR